MFAVLLATFALVAALVQVIRLALTDCDLTLQWASKFGRKVESLKGQVVWITGASSGIGEALAYRLAAAGCKLVLSARRVEELDRVKKQCLLTGPLKTEDVMMLPLDVTKFDTHADATSSVLQHFGQIDVLVNNAGCSQQGSFVNTMLEVDRQMLELNVLGVLSLSKCVLPHMMERRKGHMVVTSSVVGKMGSPIAASYTGSKHALHGWFDVLRCEGREFNLDVTLLCPGPVHSNIAKNAFTGEPGKVLKAGPAIISDEGRMATERCAHLSAVAIANRLHEVWISKHPYLLATYLAQYMPAVYTSVLERMLLKSLTTVRDGKMASGS